MSLKVLVISAAFGAGHVKAAEAVIEGFLQKNPEAEVIHVDFGEFINRPLNSTLKTTYIDMIKYTPKLWGKFYYKTADISEGSLFQRFLNGIGRRQFLKYIHSLQPDLIVCTYPVIAGVLSQLKKERRLNVPLATVVTDYGIHGQWVHQDVDLYLVGSEEVLEALVNRGIHRDCIKITGIPVSIRFEQQLDRQALMKQFSLNEQVPTVLIMGGAYGVLGSAVSVCQMLVQRENPVQVIIVCGKDKQLYRSLKPLASASKHQVLLFGFVRNVEELMTVADLVITKTGGLTVTEALTKHLPIVTYKPIPGQEEENAEFLLRKGAGRIAYTEEQLNRIIAILLENLEVREGMRIAASRVLPGHAAERAVEYILELRNPVSQHSKRVS
ncbi:UDP-N-acetylglucosamine:LPS N-acetylglucosamine transferase [Desulfitobacterium dichloroeliminans LMG P-21439]|uniref:UDP-N-acetylglucosamine:LPS N-acetylglucosamine transferase n=1 Tax=Desulfitobacterium dichloroeliminans (strain LMG P-21439 / DCA1) TaxID=871963 RepID=L0F2M1_DESDL|nr:glycosyltransferase [Desulfitobacterium dichloroeliminans]AGA68074.1 UDP-N-acetylglucosamine:LPS N-acetylglucosamine transferase [Desulfitobacterium dichloroeliminans LMG P-21439]